MWYMWIAEKKEVWGLGDEMFWPNVEMRRYGLTNGEMQAGKMEMIGRKIDGYKREA